MKYEKPEVVEVATAMVAIQNIKVEVSDDSNLDTAPAYEDWE